LPSNFADLPDVSFLVPNLKHDMHSGSISVGDTWLAQHVDPYGSGQGPITACWC